jgi:hypothetical protein
MIFRQLFEPVSGTYSYVLASGRGGEALIIDPVPPATIPAYHARTKGEMFTRPHER